MDRNEQKTSAPMIGAASLLVIFAVLCMTVFALLGLSAVRADGRLSDVRAEAVADYYTADSRAEEILAQLRRGEMPGGVRLSEGIYTYSCPISDTQALLVRVRQEDWQILSWQAVSTATWQGSDELPVWDGSIGSEH